MEKLKKILFTYEALAGVFIIISLIIKIGIILHYGNAFNLGSDDENYMRTARILLERQTLVYYRINEPTIFIMPAFPIFVAAIFKIFGSGDAGIEAVRIAQAVLSSVAVVYIYLIARHMFNKTIAAAATFVVSFYPPNLTISGYLLTEALFFLFLYMIIYYYLKALEQDKILPYAICGLIWGLATLTRPVIALLPGVFLFYALFIKKIGFWKTVKTGMIMSAVFVMVMSPWWIRNFVVFGEFIPLTESSGNPMLQGTYINYDQSNPTLYKMQETERKQNQEEVRVAKERMKDGFTNNFFEYLKWYTVGKTRLLWRDPFYWREVLGITLTRVKQVHQIILLGFIGLIAALAVNFKKHAFCLLVLLYFNASYCVYLTFDRYGYPFIPIVSIYLVYLTVLLTESALKRLKKLTVLRIA